jgi:transposase
MSKHVPGRHRKQTVLFPDMLDDYVDEENPVRFIDAFIESLNLEKLGFNHSIPNDVGRPSYDPSDLQSSFLVQLVLLLYCMMSNTSVHCLFCSHP